MMPIVRKLNPDEVQTLERKVTGVRRDTEEQYDAYIRDYMPGEYGKALLAENEKKTTVRNRLRSAAERHGLTLDFRRTKDQRLQFRVNAAHNGQDIDEEYQDEALPSEPEPVQEVPAPQPKKGRRKSQAV